MAVNKNFVVKHGLEVSNNLLVADATSSKVGIGTTIPLSALDVRGGIAASTAYISGIATVNGRFNVGVGGSILSILTSKLVGVGTVTPAYLLDVHSNTSSGTTALYVRGDSQVTGRFNTNNLNVSGISTFSGGVVIGSGIITSSNPGVTTVVYYGDGRYLEGVIGGVGLATTGGMVGVGATLLNFVGAGVSSVTFNPITGIATVNIVGGGGGATTTSKSTTTYTATSGQTTFAATYVVGNGSVDVYLNGVRLSNAEFTATNGTSVVLTDPAIAGDTVDVVVFDFGNSVRGIQGTDGLQGIQGISGAFAGQGIQGVQGIQGDLGIQGTQGVQGLDGLFAGQGIQGVQGIQGDLGIQGTQGIQGLDGAFVAQGVQGTTGLQGLQGTQGIQGRQGTQGIRGSDGIQGINLSDDITTDFEHFIVFKEATGITSTARVSTTKLTFNPSTGTVTASEFNATSDKRLKENIQPLENSIDVLKNINPVKFSWKETGQTSYGVIAQELEALLPELVKNGNEYKSVSYIPLIALLIEAIKKHQEQIDELRNKIIDK